ncbi:hypothetical protein Cgig2_032482 [Carnegiea gigantea]|uniref:Plastid division protein PDV2 n=1 Tax=Carnegiea gigantea TaxID=171969 RepID=A0A9Q1KYH2_9CARY|nr:hypothetical protein Cgig2_032482 [Carnegiea gigantea]
MEMEEERIGLVLLRASELRSKIANCIHKTTSAQSQIQSDGDNLNHVDGPNDRSSSSMGNTDDADEEAEAILNICYAFDSLEAQLASFQALQQQQQYEREALIGEIEYSRKMLLKKLGEYTGEHLDVIREAEAFASMKVEHSNELLLPPYPTRSPRSLVLDNSNLNRVSYTRKLMQNGFSSGELPNGSKRNHPQRSSNKLWGGLKFLIHSTAKTMLTLVGVISLLTLAGFETRLCKKGSNLKSLTLFQQPNAEEKRLVAQCPPGKVPVMEDGEIRCVVKERVEIPFDSVAENADVNYGCG